MKENTKKIIKSYVYNPFSWSKAALVALLGLLVGIIIPTAGILVALVLYEPYLPDPEFLEDYKPPMVSEVYSADGVKIGQFAGRRRIWVSLDEVSPNLINALLAAEDNDFYSHWGVSIPGITRAMLKNVKARRIVQGASTITQQLSKNLFLSSEQKYSRKIKEALTSVLIEREYSKSEILELYLNQNFMGKGCYGVQAASQFYFNRDADSLNIEQAAFLAGLLKAPSAYLRKPERALKRRNFVIGAMGRQIDEIDDRMVDSLSALPLEIELNNYDNYKAPYFVEDIRRYIVEKYGEEFLYNGGIKIYTTLDYSIQELVDDALEDKLASLQKWNQNIHHNDDSVYTFKVWDPDSGDTVHVWKKVQGAVVVMDPQTGYIKAMAGGRNFYESQFNRATQAKRQPGSAFKPFVYVAAIDNGFQPSDLIDDTPETFPMEEGKVWRPRNYDGKYMGEITLRKALMKSKNLAAIHLAEKVGPKRIAFYAKKLGIDSVIEPYLSIAMGSSVCTVLEITRAYCPFANGGYKVEPIFITRIEDNEGKIIEQNVEQREEVLPAGVAYAMSSIMQSVIDHGTGYGARLSGFERPAGGKTGTTNDCTDAWFVGYTPQLCTGVWVGYDDIIPLGKTQTGSRAALPVWTNVMLNAHKGMVVRDFAIPTDEVVFKTVCSESHLLATSRCPDTEKEVYLRKNPVPEEYCPQSHRGSSDVRRPRKRSEDIVPKPAENEDENKPTNNKPKKKSRL